MVNRISGNCIPGFGLSKVDPGTAIHDFSRFRNGLSMVYACLTSCIIDIVLSNAV